MAVLNSNAELLSRLSDKTLEARFLAIVTEGLNCSPFEGRAVLQAVDEVYGPYLGSHGAKAPPGYISLLAVDADEPAGKPLAACRKVTLLLQLHRGPQDDRLLRDEGAQAFRRERLPALLQEALSQGGLLTREDLAFRVFFCGARTISRDLAALRCADPQPHLPLRGTVHDIGPVLTHRTEIVRLALAGKTMSEISLAMHHSPPAVANYLQTFTRVARLVRENVAADQIAFLLGRGPTLVQKYVELYNGCVGNQLFSQSLEQLLRSGESGGKIGTSPRGGGAHGHRS